MKHFIEKLLRCHQGVAAIEFALIAPVILVMMIGATDYGLAAINKITLTSAVRSGVQIVLGGNTNTATIRQAVVDASSLGLALSNVSTAQFCECADGTTLTCGGTCGDGSKTRYFLQITADHLYQPVLLQTPIALSATSTVRYN